MVCVILTYGCTISWQRKLHITVSLSYKEGELKSPVIATQEKIWIKNILEE